MPACPRDNQYSTLPPPGFPETNIALKRAQLVELLEQIIEKCQHDPTFLAQQSKQTDLVVSIAQLTLLSEPISATDRRDFLNNIVSIGQDLLADENNAETDSSVGSCPSSNENIVPLSTILPSNPTMNDGDFSLDDLANEYLQNEPTPSSSSSSSSNDKRTTPSEPEELDLTADNRSKNYLSSSPSTPITNVLSALVMPAVSTEPILTKPPLESILFSNRLSSHDAADDADGIWKEESSPFGQMFCKKVNEMDSTVTQRISTCLLDRSLYERLTRLIALLPKQCVRNSVQQLTIRHNEQLHRPPRPNREYQHHPNRPTFHQNSVQSQSMPRYQNAQNPRYYSNPNFPNQQGNPNGYFVDRRSQQQQQRYNPPFAPYPPDQQLYQQKGPPRNNPYNNGYQQQQQQQQQQPQQQQQKKKPQTNNQQVSSQYQQQRGTRKGPGGGNKSNTPASDQNVQPK